MGENKMPCENLSCYIIPMLHEAIRTLRTASMETMDGNRGIDDASFLADLDGFLHDCDVLHPSTDLHPATTDLLQDSNQLVAETEALLASYATKTTHVHVQQDHTRTSTVKTTKTPEELRRELKNAQAAKRRHRYRVKLKNERQTLQEQEKTLSEELKTLQSARKKTRTIQENSIAAPLWKSIASRQMDGRVVAEEQERRLKNAVASRAKVIQEVNEMIRQQLCVVNAPDTQEMAKESNGVELDPDDIALFEEYLQDMDVVYKQTDEAFQASGVEENPAASYKVEPRWKRDGDLEYFENLDVSLIPSSFERTSSAMWQAMLHVHRQKDRQHYRGVTDSEDTIAVKCRIPSPKETGERVDMLIHLVTKRFVEADRMIIVWRALTEGDDEFAGMHSDETGWCVVRSTSTVDNGAATTVLQTFTRFIPMTIATTFGNKTQADQFAKLVVTSGEEDGSEIARMMESLLIEDPPMQAIVKGGKF